MKKNLLRLVLTAMITLSLPLMIYASQQEYSISAIDLIIKVTDELNVLTRNVSEGNPVLDKLETDAVSIQSSFIHNDIYLNAFPDDLSYEILVTASEINDNSVTDFKNLTDEDFTDYINTVTTQFESSEYQELLDIGVYSNDNSKYIRTYSHNTLNNTSVYVTKYYTVFNDYNYYFTIQTNKEINESLERTLLDIIDSAQYTEVKGSITESSLFMEFYEMIVGFGITILVLGGIIFMLTRSSKHSK